MTLTQCIRPHHSAAATLLHGCEQACYAAQGIGCKGDDAELPCAFVVEVLVDLGQPRTHEDQVVGIIQCCNHGE